MNKQQLYTFGGALLASTALSGAAHAITFGKINNLLQGFSTTPFSITNTLFSTTASTANTVVITPGKTRVAATFSNIYSVATAPGTRFSVEISPTGATFGSSTAVLSNVNFLNSFSGVTTFTSTITANSVCSGSIGFGTQFVIDGCTASFTTGGANQSVHIGGLLFSGVTFTNASGLATAGNSISLTGRVYNTATSGNFEAAATGTIITSAATFTASISAAPNVTVSATTTPTAFTALSTSNISGSTLTMELIRVAITAGGALRADLSELATPATELSSARVTVTSALLSSASVANVHVSDSAGATIAATLQLTVANFSGGSATFALTDAQVSSFAVRVAFNGTAAIPQVAAGTASVTFGFDANAGQNVGSVSGTTAASNQGGFRAEVNTFNASTNGPFGSFLRIHNNGGVAGAVTITIRDDAHDSGAMLGSSFTTAAIQSGSTMQLSAAEMEGTDTSTKLPSGGANVPVASRFGSYTLNVSGPIVGYVQHILFDGNSVADLSSFRNGGSTTANAAP